MTIPGRVAMRLCCELLAALDFVHKLELVHCDVKPGNILLDGEGSLLLSDFGSVVATCCAYTSQVCYKVSSLWYRAPELILGADRFGPEVDVWGAGCCAFELLTGLHAFAGASEEATLFKIYQRCGAPQRRSTLRTLRHFRNGVRREKRPREFLREPMLGHKLTNFGQYVLSRMLQTDPMRRPPAATGALFATEELAKSWSYV